MWQDSAEISVEPRVQPLFIAHWRGEYYKISTGEIEDEWRTHPVVNVAGRTDTHIEVIRKHRCLKVRPRRFIEVVNDLIRDGMLALRAIELLLRD
jgi:hypothetical protein